MGQSIHQLTQFEEFLGMFENIYNLFKTKLGINEFLFTCFCQRAAPRPIERRLDWVFYKTEMKIWAVGCGVGWTVLKKVWADYEQLLRVGFSTFCGQKKKF